ncbi:MAG TPA: DUF1326 domain-containing protein [Gemmatimonadaceae bacterium]|nr:DUF1326 domain-containing protein [Gemmatimonadaceae bacterium]
MTAPSWNISGQYYETCSCDYVCPCVLQQMQVEPSKGRCTFAMAFQVESGTFGSESLDGVAFIVLGLTPGAMAKGNWSVGLIVDDRATPAQRDAIAAITSGNAGGPMAGVTGLVTKFLGVESAPIRIDHTGAQWSVTAASMVDMAAQPAMGMNPNATAPLMLTNTGHPAADSLLLAHALKSHVDALGLSWDDTSGTNNGQFAPFDWRSA